MADVSWGKDFWRTFQEAKKKGGPDESYLRRIKEFEKFNSGLSDDPYGPPAKKKPIVFMDFYYWVKVLLRQLRGTDK